MMSNLRVTLLAVLTTAACSPGTSSKGQLITCSTDPDTGVVVRCEPGDDSSDPNSCQDIDEDGDGDPHDDDDAVARTADGGDDDSADDDSDDDGIDDDHDCDEQEGEDDDSSELPYDVRMQQGETVTPILDAFAEKGGAPAEILAVEMDSSGGSAWRLSELQAGTSFVVNALDCTHAGNRDVGRDRVIVKWKNADGTTESDHLDLRYCD